MTILIGVALVLEGTKQLVRWTEVLVPRPFFGFFPDDYSQILIHVVLGVFSVLAGYWFLKLNIKGFYLAILLGIFHIVSDALSWKLWDPVVEQMVLARRELQGISVRDGEFEFMQSLFPEATIAAAALAVIAIFPTHKRFDPSWGS